MLVRAAQILATTAAACAAALAAAVAIAPPAAAGCYGVTDTAEACVYPQNVHVDPDGGPYVGDCVYFTSQCQQVGTNLPWVTTTGTVVEIV